MKSEYFSFEKLKMSLSDVAVCNYIGWSGLEIFKFLIPKGKSITNSLVNDFKTELVNKEKIFFTFDGDIELESDEFNFVLERFDAIDFKNEQKYKFKSLKDTSIFMISSKNSKKIEEKSIAFNFEKDVEKKDLWGGQIISRPYEGKEFTLVLFELKTGFKFSDKGHPNQQITWVVDGEMDFYSDNKEQLLNTDIGVSIGPNHSHGGVSKGAIGFDAFFPKRVEEKYKNI